MKEQLSKHLSRSIPLNEGEILSSIEIPPTPELGDYSFPCFALSKKLKQNPNQIAEQLSKKIQTGKFLEKVESKGPYINLFLNKTELAKQVLSSIKNKKILIEMSSPNIAKPFGIGHLRSTIIGNSIANTSSFLNYKTIKLNYLGDWGTPFGKIIAGYKKFGSQKKLDTEPIKHLYEIYVKASKDKEMEDLGKEYFKKLEQGDKETKKLWKKFKEISNKEFQKIYNLLNIKFDVTSGESEYNKKIKTVLLQLKSKKLLEKSEGAEIINLGKYNLGTALIRKSDGTTLYSTRDLTAAIDRYKKYKFEKMIYEVGSEQKLHFKQIFKILQLLNYKWAKNLTHIDHGLYLDKDGKKFATRKGKTIFLEEIIEETKELAKKQIKKREKALEENELNNRASKIALAAIFYGDLKNYRSNNIVFDIKRFLSFEGNTGPYLLYTYARAKSILKKAKKKIPTTHKTKNIQNIEKNLIIQLAQFPEVVIQAHQSLSPNLIANYAHQIAQTFNEFYHSSKVIGSEQEAFRLQLVDSFSQVLKNALNLLGIQPLETM